MEMIDDLMLFVDAAGNLELYIDYINFELYDHMGTVSHTCVICFSLHMNRIMRKPT